jgi:phosphatidylglycerol lysyltransferase
LLSAFIAAQLLGLVSHVPGGIGVFESLMVVLMTPAVAASDLLPALVAYRVIYYLLPFAVAIAIVVADEARQSRAAIRRAGSIAGALGASAAPRVLAAATFLAGALLLFSGATPAVASRLSWLARVVPYPLLEISHFTGSVVGVVLLLLSQAISRRVDAAWGLSVVSLAVGILASLFKGGDYEEALLLVALMAALVTARSRFDRKAAVFDAPFSMAWFMAVLSVVAASLFLGAFAFKHVDYSHELWWRFALKADAPRFLRASVGAGVTVLAFGLRHLLGPARADRSTPSGDDLGEAARVIGAQRAVYPNLVFLRDKSLLWNAERTAFLMFAVQGRTWVALHDPVGPRNAAADLVCEFLSQVRASGGIPVFYEVRPDFLQFYADVGLALAKIGEDAIVPLQTFTLDGSARKGLRTTLSRLTREGLSFRVLPAPEAAARLDELQVVSDEWLSRKAAAEKGFSLGFFDREYLSRFPVAVLEHDGRIEAFANVWEGAGRDELSVDLMRYRSHVPACTTEGLLIHLILWGRDRGYSTFGLGMAPLAGIEAAGIGPRWRRLARYVYRHGESFYNFQGVRAFKEKFSPDWESRYLAYPGGLTEARVLADVSALIAGGYRRIFWQ